MGGIVSFQVTEEYQVRLGSNIIKNCKSILAFAGKPFFTLKRHEDGYLGIYFDIHDSQGNKIAVVKRNELYFTKETDTDLFTANATKDLYEVKERSSGRVIFSIKKRSLATPNELDICFATYLPNGWLFQATPEKMNLADSSFIECFIEDCETAIEIGPSMLKSPRMESPLAFFREFVTRH